jgi:hypothetical protein
MTVPLVAPTTGWREVKQLQYLFHADFGAHAIKGDTGHVHFSIGV